MSREGPASLPVVVPERNWRKEKQERWLTAFRRRKERERRVFWVRSKRIATAMYILDRELHEQTVRWELRELRNARIEFNEALTSINTDYPGFKYQLLIIDPLPWEEEEE